MINCRLWLQDMQCVGGIAATVCGDCRWCACKSFHGWRRRRRSSALTTILHLTQSAILCTIDLPKMWQYSRAIFFIFNEGEVEMYLLLVLHFIFVEKWKKVAQLTSPHMFGAPTVLSPYILQGMMFGYATDETECAMPLTLLLAHRLNERLHKLRQDGTLLWALPCSKTQVG